MALLKYDITKRSEDARRSTRRAEIRLAKQFNEAGGIEDEMRCSLSQLKREQGYLARELQGLRFEARQFAKASERQETTRHVEPIMGFYMEADLASGASRSRSASVKKSDYGKNYFGYYSAPGSHKKHNKTTKEIDSTLDNYFHKIEDLMQAERTEKQLKEQRKLNKIVQDKLDNWMNKNPIKTTKRNMSTTEVSYDRNISRLQSEEELKDRKTNDKEVNTASTDENKTVDLFQKRSSTTLTFDDKQLDEQEVEEQLPKKPVSAKSNRKESKQATSPLLKQSSNGFVFDANLHAPDGRLRMVHRMPDFVLAFNEAKQVRYLRTREKRDFEDPLSVSEMLE